MNFFTGVVLFLSSMLAIAQIAPVVGDMQRAKEAQAHSVAFKAQQEASTVKACAEGHTSIIMYKGVWCKGV